MQFSFLFCLIFKKELLLGTKASDCKEEDSSSLLRAGEGWAEHPIKRCAYVPNAESVSAPVWKRTLANLANCRVFSWDHPRKAVGCALGEQQWLQRCKFWPQVKPGFLSELPSL